MNVLRRKIGFLSGIIGFFCLLGLPTPDGLSLEAQKVGAVALLMAIWWVTEVIHLGATALLPLALFPILNILSMTETASSYAHPNIYLFMGGFMLAVTMQKWNLHKRLALHLIVAIGGGPRKMVGGFMIAAAFLSMWITNTAAAVLLLPVAMAVVEKESSLFKNISSNQLGPVLMLGIAYASSIGGVATLIGTPPNLIFTGQVSAFFPELAPIGFVQWSLFAIPLALGYLLFTWAYLVFVHSKLPDDDTGAQELIKKDLDALGPWSREEKQVLTIFILTAVAWITRSDLTLGSWSLPGWQQLLGRKDIHDGTVGMAAALVLFLTPVKWRTMEFLLDWNSAKRIHWDVLLLFGGGFTLAEGLKTTGFAAWIGESFSVLHGLPLPILLLGVCFMMTFLTEIMSNTATITIALPILAAASSTLNIHPFLLMIPATLSASFAFMLPMATPPNAIVFGSGYLSVFRMAKAGLVLNLVGILWITFLVLTYAPLIFDF